MYMRVDMQLTMHMHICKSNVSNCNIYITYDSAHVCTQTYVS